MAFNDLFHSEADFLRFTAYSSATSLNQRSLGMFGRNRRVQWFHSGRHRAATFYQCVIWEKIFFVFLCFFVFSLCIKFSLCYYKSNVCTQCFSTCSLKFLYNVLERQHILVYFQSLFFFYTSKERLLKLLEKN